MLGQSQGAVPLPDRQSGFALLIVLWSAVLLAVLTTQITAAGRSETQLATNVRAAAEAQAAADAGIALAVFHVLDPATSWAADNRPHAETLGRFALTIAVQDENGKLNPNLAPEDLLAAVLTAEGADAATARAVAAAVVDWHFPGFAPQKQLRYRAAGRAYGPPGQPFRSLDELGLVLGMTPALLARVTPHLSIYTDGALDYGHADPVLQAVMRATMGTPPPVPLQPPPPSVATITARAADARGARFTRRATVQFVRDQPAIPYRVLDWRAE